MENMPKNMAQITNINELDYVIKKIFLNFTIKAKNVDTYTLNKPFDALDTSKLLYGAGNDTLLELFDSATNNTELIQSWNIELMEFWAKPRAECALVVKL